MKIHKSHSRLDLIELINTIDIPIVFSHVDNKASIQEKLKDIICNESKQKVLSSPNVYKINNYTDLKCYLDKPNPKKILSVKEKKQIMLICKHIIFYCRNGKCLEFSEYYNDEKQIYDDMDYIKQWGDIPSVRRCCKLMNIDLKEQDHFIPLVSPQIQLTLNKKTTDKPTVVPSIIVNKGTFVVSFK